MPETAVPDLKRWRALVDQTLRGVPFERRMVRRLPGGLRLPALHTDRPSDPEASSLIRALGRDGRWEVAAEHAVGHPGGAHLLQQDLMRGIDSIVLTGCTDAADARTVLAAVALDTTGVVWAAGGTVAERAAVLSEVAAAQGGAPGRVWGAIGADPYDRYFAHGAPLPTDATWAVIARCTQSRPEHLATVAVQALAVRESGGSAVTELGALLASAAASLRGLMAAGLKVSDIARATRLTLGIGRDQLVGIAALRALRLCWARLCGAFGASDAASTRAPIHAVQLACWQTRHDPWVNLLRSTLAGFVGAVGGADALTLRPYDAPAGRPSELGQRMATNTQILLAEESHLATVCDPAAGSYALEHLTQQLAQGAWAVLQEIEAQGGLDADAGRAVLVDRVRTERDAELLRIDQRKTALVGVSDFPANAEQALAAVADRPAEGPLPPVRFSRKWEDLRDAAEAHPDTPPVFLATWGPLARHSARAMFATNLLQAGGLKTVDPGGGTSVSELAAAFEASGATAAVICGADADYPAVVPELASSLRAAGAETVWVAGRPPPEGAEAWTQAGVCDFIFTGCDARSRLAALHTSLGVCL